MTQTSGPAGATLHTTRVGERGSWVVFCHGLFGQGKNWTRVAKVVARSHRVLLLDMPQHGQSPWTPDFDYLDAADQVVATVAAHVGRWPVSLVGHSMGGKIAMVVALRHPQRVRRLCIVDVAPVAYGHSEEFERYIAAMRGLDRATLSSRVKADAALSAVVRDPTVRAFLLQNLRNDPDRGWYWQPNLAVLERRLDVITGWPAERLAGVAPYSGPVMWVRGDRSSHVDDAMAPAMAALFPRVRRVTVKGAGHWVHSDQPDAFTAVIRHFLGD